MRLKKSELTPIPRYKKFDLEQTLDLMEYID